MAAEDDSHIAISGRALSLFIGAALSGGIGVGTTLGPQLDKAALQACYDNSERAIEVAVQHGAELQSLREYIRDRTADRYSGKDASEDWRQQYRVNDEVFRRLERLEK